jgi:hypothetical protein
MILKVFFAQKSMILFWKTNIIKVEEKKELKNR